MINYTITAATKRIDSRGFLVDFLKGDEVLPIHRLLGQIYFVTFDGKKVIRGNHFHKKKEEWFVAVRGKLKVILEDVVTKERVEFMLNGDDADYKRVYIGRNVGHAFVSLSKKAEMINYASKPYHSNDTDMHTYILA